ncbi:YfhO family protein [Geomonas sp. Red32]|uniref:YfhO family protein n=1 Tax=Geomonas sp. Red32 TaxID=2912856 RepID=UPI00202CE01F|nr:YfhO family protein [Geomonas sp. Red32]MCM0080602.1 YfhO family protein [Geomonas sp. Red32]
MRGGGWLRSWGPAALVAALGTLTPLVWVWARGMTLVQRDSAGVYAPLRRLAGEALRSGSLPLWNPYCATGMPFLGETIHGVLHPVSVAAAFLFPGDGLDPLMGGYALCAGLGAGLLAAVFGASRSSSVLAGFAYGLAGYPLSMTGNLVFLAGAATVPWVLAAFRLCGTRPGAGSFALAAFAVASAAFSGDIQMLAVATAAGLALAAEGGGRRGLAVACGGAVVGALLAGVQLAPSWSFLQLTNRALPLPDYDVRQWDLAPWRLVELVSPGFFWWPQDGPQTAPVYMSLGNPTWFNVPFAESVFVGAGTLLLAVSGIRSSRSGRVAALLAAVALWLAMGRYLGARAIQDLVPVFKGFRYGEKYLPVVLAFLALLAALGADRVAGDRKVARRYALAGAVTASVALAAWLAAKALPGRLDPAVASHLAHGAPHALLAGVAVAACSLAAMRGRSAACRIGLAATVWVACCAASGYALRPGRPEARVNAAPPAIEAPSPGLRVFNAGGVPQHAPRQGWDAIDELDYGVLTSMAANANARYRIDNLSVDTGLFPIRWFRLNDALGPELALAAPRFAVTHLVLPRGGADQNLLRPMTATGTLQQTDPRNGMEIWSILHRPWAGFAKAVIPVADDEQARAALVDETRRGGREAIVETGAILPVAPGAVLSLSRRAERIEVAGEAAAGATMVINDAFWPGWRAAIDGREVPILAADALVRAVVWPAGKHTLVMEYRPDELRVGKLLSLAGGVLLVAGIFLLGRLSPSSPRRDAA